MAKRKHQDNHAGGPATKKGIYTASFRPPTPPPPVPQQNPTVPIVLPPALVQQVLANSANSPQPIPTSGLLVHVSTNTATQLQKFLQATPQPPILPLTGFTAINTIYFCFLKQNYPTLGATYLEFMFRACDKDLQRTQARLREQYPALPCCSNPVVDGFTLKYNPQDVFLHTPASLFQLYGLVGQMENRLKDTSKKISPVEQERLQDVLNYCKAILINAAHRKEKVLDLHWLNLRSAMRIVKEFVNFHKEALEAQKRAYPGWTITVPVEIITGQGIHSAGKKAVLRPNVLQYLIIKGYEVKKSPGNPGSFIVTVE